MIGPISIEGKKEETIGLLEVNARSSLIRTFQYKIFS